MKRVRGAGLVLVPRAVRVVRGPDRVIRERGGRRFPSDLDGVLAPVGARLLRDLRVGVRGLERRLLVEMDDDPLVGGHLRGVDLAVRRHGDAELVPKDHRVLAARREEEQVLALRRLLDAGLVAALHAPEGQVVEEGRVVRRRLPVGDVDEADVGVLVEPNRVREGRRPRAREGDAADRRRAHDVFRRAVVHVEDVVADHAVGIIREMAGVRRHGAPGSRRAEGDRQGAVDVVENAGGRDVASETLLERGRASHVGIADVREVHLVAALDPDAPRTGPKRRLEVDEGRVGDL